MSVQLASEKVVVAAPMSFAGSAQRTWKLTRKGPSWAKPLLIIAAVIIIALWWSVDLIWYFIFGLLLVPYRLIRRGSRKRKAEELRHREMMSAIEQQQRSAPPNV